MISSFKNYWQSDTKLSEDDIRYMLSLAVARQLRKNEFILHEGQICRHKFFVASGLLRVFSTTSDGSEHINRFLPENSWTMDKESYDRQAPAQTSISAVEPSNILFWAKADFEKLTEDLPALKSFTEQLTLDHIYNVSKRLLNALSGTPKERYQNFVKNHPGLLLRLPLKMVASYLGISLRTLDRIRHAQLPNS